MEIEEEAPVLPFTIKDAEGNILFRDSIHFDSVTELRNASHAERETLMQERYQTYLDFIEQQANIAPVEE